MLKQPQLTVATNVASSLKSPRSRSGSVHNGSKAMPQSKPRMIKRKNKVNFQEIEGSIAEQRAYEFLVRELEAKNWMEKMLNQTLDFNIANLCDKLRDGVLLCYLAAVFAPAVVHNVSKQVRILKMGSTLNILAIENYQLFLKACDSIDFPTIYNFECTFFAFLRFFR